MFFQTRTLTQIHKLKLIELSQKIWKTDPRDTEKMK